MQGLTQAYVRIVLGTHLGQLYSSQGTSTNLDSSDDL